MVAEIEADWRSSAAVRSGRSRPLGSPAAQQHLQRSRRAAAESQGLATRCPTHSAAPRVGSAAPRVGGGRAAPRHREAPPPPAALATSRQSTSRSSRSMIGAAQLPAAFRGLAECGWAVSSSGPRRSKLDGHSPPQRCARWRGVRPRRTSTKTVSRSFGGSERCGISIHCANRRAATVGAHPATHRGWQGTTKQQPARAESTTKTSRLKKGGSTSPRRISSPPNEAQGRGEHVGALTFVPSLVAGVHCNRKPSIHVERKLNCC